MEKEIRDFFRRIIVTVSTGLLWLLINSTAGIMYGLFFFEKKPGAGNIIFYLWLLVSGAFLLRFFIKTWRKKFPVE